MSGFPVGKTVDRLAQLVHKIKAFKALEMWGSLKMRLGKAPRRVFHKIRGNFDSSPFQKVSLLVNEEIPGRRKRLDIEFEEAKSLKSSIKLDPKFLESIKFEGPDRRRHIIEFDDQGNFKFPLR